MKLLRWGERDGERPGIVDSQGNIRDFSSVIHDWNGDTLSDRVLNKARRADLDCLPIVPKDVRIGPCVGNVGKFLCIGLNYSDHAAEAGVSVPPEPILFSKATSAISGPNDPILLPRHSVKTDWEVELAVVIGKKASYVEEADAAGHIAGYCIVNDLSEREYQLERHGTWDKGKGCDTFGPLGPYLVTRDEVPDPQSLDMLLKVNDQVYQNGSTSTMVFPVLAIISYVSRFMTLYPGDVIATGTPPGVGMGQKPPVYLVDGDIVELEISGLGKQRQQVRASML